MERYIDADLFVEWQDNRQEADLYMGWDYVKQCLYDDYVKADVVPVVYAHNESETSFMCSNCTFADFGLFNHGGKYTPKYCPQCGAKMDEVVDDE